MTEGNTNITHKGFEFIPFAKLYPEPTFSTKKASGKQWISYGEQDDAPAYILGLLDKSSDHNAIVTNTIAYVQGNGLVPPSDGRAKAMFQNGEESIVSPNDLNEINKKLARDLVVFGGCLLNVRWTRDKSSIADVHYVDVASMRIDGDWEGYWLSSDWSNVRKHVPEFYPSFSTEEGGSQLLYVKGPSARNTPYALPSYWSARQSISLQESIQKYNGNRLQNGFNPSGVISFNENPTKEEFDQFNAALKKYAVGPDGEFASGFLLANANVTIMPFQAASGPKDYEWISTFADQRIRAAHRVPNSGAIFGLSRGDNPQGFSQQDLESEFELYNQSVVRPLQNVLLSVWNMLGRINGVGKFEIDPYQLFDNAAVKGGGEKGASSASGASESINVDATANVQATALNGAQVDSLVGIITAVSEGKLTAATAKPLIRVAFPATPESEIDAMLAGIKPTEPEPAPVQPINPIPNGNAPDTDSNT